MATLSDLRVILLDLSQPIAKRTHAAFKLRTSATAECASVIAEALLNTQDSSLMRHELAYILGQMQYKHICSTLIQILEDESEDLLVRHECAEAMGAIGVEETMQILEKFISHPSPEISETCQIAVDLLKWKNLGEKQAQQGAIYLSHDPAPPLTTQQLSSQQSGVVIADFARKLMDPSFSLFERYRAMFSLRNMNSDDAALALVNGFQDSSALFRHEIAYVLGQMQRPVTAAALITVLERKDEHRMVRHEAAEALGAIGGEEVEAVLKQYLKDPEAVVHESCEVALDVIDYWTTNQFD